MLFKFLEVIIQNTQCVHLFDNNFIRDPNMFKRQAVLVVCGTCPKFPCYWLFDITPPFVQHVLTMLSIYLSFHSFSSTVIKTTHVMSLFDQVVC